jgi:osmotically-inducible protein OsmY
MRSDADFKRDVEDELKWDPDIDATDIALAVKSGVVTLTGYVRSYAHKFAAERAAKRVAGVVGVANDLEVRLTAADQRPDPEIAREAVANLKIWLPNSWENIKAIVQNGLVTLEGEVEWNYQREYAERAVRWIRGVKGVSNLVGLKLHDQPRQEEIKHKIEGIPAQRRGRCEPCDCGDTWNRGGPQRRGAILGGTRGSRTCRLARARGHQGG